jgi:predicted phosphodiesterase
MRILVVSDIHANYAALTAVFKDAGNFDQIWCLGDVVGYGPEPNECVERLRSYNALCLAGNHDLGVVGKIPLWDFNRDALEAIAWTRHWLALDNRDWLESLPSMQAMPEYNLTLVHASPRDPVWEYVGSPPVARDSLNAIQTPLCLNGHTHVPIIFRKPAFEAGIFTERLPVNQPISLDLDRMLINPGSVGQPRDDDPRAAYVLLDTDAQTLVHHRVQYDVAATQKKIRAVKLPENLARRLRFGQ